MSVPPRPPTTPVRVPPASKAAAPSAVARARPVTLSVQPDSRNVLIVEDDADTREMVSALLAMEGFNAVAAEDGLEALHLLRAVRHKAPHAPCLVLLDLSMPRLGGHEFRRAQLGDSTVAGVPVAVLSGAVDAERLAASLGAVATVTKPVDLDLLLEIVRRYCR